MASRTTKTTKKAPVKSRSKVVKKKSNNSNSLLVFLKKKPAIVFIVVFGIVGSVFLYRSFAATTNLEAETATKSNEVVIASDTSASGGKYAQFANTAPLASS